LWWGKHWAEWFAVISAGLYLPWEFYHFTLHPRLFTGGVIVFNLALIYYLGTLLARQRAHRKRHATARSGSP
jgi:uncharacterized membrane protein (DUF2068 family)